MSSDRPESERELMELWRSQPAPADGLDLEVLMARSTTFTRQIRHRNLREWGAALLVGLGFTVLGVTSTDAALRLSCALSVAGAVLVSWVLARRGREQPLPLEATSLEHLRVHRENLAIQEKLLRSVPRWYIAPLMPGLLLFDVANFMDLHANPAHRRPSGLSLAVELIAFGLQVGLVAVIGWANHVAARKLGEELRALDAAVPGGAPPQARDGGPAAML
jgi:hypothetical protein